MLRKGTKHGIRNHTKNFCFHSTINPSEDFRQNEISSLERHHSKGTRLFAKAQASQKTFSLSPSLAIRKSNKPTIMKDNWPEKMLLLRLLLASLSLNWIFFSFSQKEAHTQSNHERTFFEFWSAEVKEEDKLEEEPVAGALWWCGKLSRHAKRSFAVQAFECCCAKWNRKMLLITFSVANGRKAGNGRL